MSVSQRLSRAGDRLFDRLRDKRAFTVNEENAVDGDFGPLRKHKYAVVVTFRRNGDPVPSPVWFGVDRDGRAYFHTSQDAAKVRRLRNDKRVLIAPSTSRGRPAGPVIRGSGRVLPKDEWPHAERTMAAAYGIGRRIYQRVLAPPEEAGVYIELTPGR